MDVLIDSRICVKKTEGGFSVDRQDISVEDTREVLQRILLFLRLSALQAVVFDPENVIDSLTYHPSADGEPQKVCIAYDYETHKIQAAVTGMKEWEVCTTLDSVVAFFNNLIISGE